MDFLLFASGILMVVLGLINIKGNISTIHAYNRRRVTEADAPKYGKAVGTGTLIIGISFIAAYGVSFLDKAIQPFLGLSGIAVGLAFMLYGQIKYNHGIF